MAAELSQLRDTAAPRPTEDKQGQHYLPTLCLAVWHPLGRDPGAPKPWRHMVVPGTVPAK